MNDSKPTQETCAQCGDVLAESAGQTICPACLMRLAVHPSPSEIASPSIDMTQSMMVESGQPNSADFPALEPDQTFGDYSIRRRLGQGGMGVVYEADHLPTSRRVALKVMGHSLDDRDARARFLREGRLAASINHPNSVYVYGTEEIEGRPTISMELVRGVTLGQRVKANGPLKSKAAVDAILQIVDGMEAAYNAGVLHRDIKPNNCFVDADGQVKVGDFGLSITAIGRDLPAGAELARTQTEITQVGSFLGTPAYASPEQLRGEPLDHRSDIYAIGVTLYYLLTSEVPFSADNMIQLLARVLDNTAPSVSGKAVDASEDLERVIAKCLKKAPGDRFASYADFRAALLPLSSRVPTPATLGSRFLAGAIDYLALAIALSPLSIWLAFSTSFQAGDPLPGLQSVLASFVGIAAQWAYFAISEWRFGKTIGKRLMGLQVVQGESRPSLSGASVRACAFVVLPSIPMLLVSMLAIELPREVQPSLNAAFLAAIVLSLVGWSRYLIHGALFLTARSSNGYAAVHELLSGTRVVQPFQPATVKQTILNGDAFDAKAGTEMIGPYHVLRLLGGTNLATAAEGTLLLGYDATLLRRVWLHVRAASDSSKSTTKDGILQTRASRIRWLGGHVGEDTAWDAYEALSGWALTNDESKSVGWSASAAALGKLSGELSLSLREESLPRHISVEHVWLTDDGSPKLLPFAVSDVRTSPLGKAGSVNSDVQHEALPDTDKPSDKLCVRVLSSVAKCFAERFHTVNGGMEAMSVSQASTLEGLINANSLADTQPLIKQLQRPQTFRVPYRIAGMLAATLVFPFFTIVSMAMMALMYQSQEASMPRVRELADVLVLMDMIGRDASGEELLAQTEALRTYARANYQDVWEDRSQMQSLYGQTHFIARKEQLDEIFSAEASAVENAEEAAKEFAIIRERHGELPSIGTLPITAQNAMFWATFSWLEFVWLPSLLTAILFRGGLLLRLFGLTVVNARGKPASRFRVFLRMLATGIAPLCALIVIVLTQSMYPSHWGFETTMLYASASFVGIACAAALIYRIRRRFFSDQCAGTYLVAS